MADFSHLDNLIDSTLDDFAKKLLETFCATVRDPETGQVDYAPKLRTIMEDRLQDFSDASN